MRIAICDDDALCRSQILDIAVDYAEERKDTDVSFQTFSEPEQLLNTVVKEGCFDIYILDIVMPGMNGIELGQELRKHNYDSKIIYLTSSKEYAIDSFRIRAFHYLVKPIEKEVFYCVLDEAISTMSIKKDRGLIVKTKESNARLTFDSIMYAELTRRVITFYLVSGRTVVSTSLRTTFSEAVQELLADSRFIPCGASMVANMHHITMVEADGIIFLNRYKVFLGKKACRDIRTAWNDYWLSEEEI